MTTRRIAAFDFDGTILRGDAVLAYLVEAGGKTRAARALVANVPGFVRIKLGSGDRNHTKARLVRSCLGGVSVEHATVIAERFVDSLTPDRLFASTMDRVAWHKDQGHECVIVSASLALYIDEFARRHGFDTALCTRLRSQDSVLTGELDGPNVRADAKARLLRAHLAGDEAEIWGYGNSPDDDAMLAMSNHAFRVDKSGHLTQEH